MTSSLLDYTENEPGRTGEGFTGCGAYYEVAKEAVDPMSKASRSRGHEAQSETSGSRPTAPGKRSLVGSAGGDGGGSALDQVSSSAGAPLDSHTSAQAGSLLGVNLGDVRVHTGGDAAAAADGLSANAFTHGSDIYFGGGAYQPGTSGGDHLIAHELVHVAQQKSAGPATQLKATDVSGVNDAAELEADRGAAAILSGMPFRATQSPAAISRDAKHEDLSGNPGEKIDPNTKKAITQHKDPTMADTRGHVAPGAAGQEARATAVKVVAGDKNHLHFNTPVCPVPDALYQEAAPGTAGFQDVTGLNGTVTQPLIEEDAGKGLYIGGGPSPNDVQQGGIGDCYFESMLMSLAQRDPNKIKKMMQPDGKGGATVTLWRRQNHDKSLWERITGGPEFDYIAVDVHVSSELRFAIGGGIWGNQLFAGQQPKSQDWWAAVNAGKLEVHRKDEFEVARWAPLLEKAFARFAQTHGQYGGARGGNAAAPTGSGYDVIEGGLPMHTLSFIYGAEADSKSADIKHQGTNWTPAQSQGVGLLTANSTVIDQLILLAGRGETSSNADADAPNLTAVAFEGDMVNRLGPAVGAAIADPDFNKLDPERQAAIRNVQTAWNTWNNLPPDQPKATPPITAKATAYTAIGTACGMVVFDGAVNHSQLEAVAKANPKTVQFDNEKNEVPAADDPKLIGFGTALATNQSPKMKVEVVGHSSTSGSDKFNLDLSQKRADEVAAKIKSGGVVDPPHTISATGVGEKDAGPGPEWRRVDIAVSAVNATNQLHDAARSPAIKAATDLMIDLRNMGTDHSWGQRNIYGNHAYSVVGVAFVSTTGVAVPLQSVPATSRSTLYPLVDTGVSTVRLRNPHHGNEPDRRGNNKAERPEDGSPSGVSSDGMFTMSLEQFFRNFSGVESGVFRRS